ncbi:MAG TPA: acyltransferase [Fibrobacteria bacterium]|nr:acyltransferase [Fibrobacteria bacterium]
MSRNRAFDQLRGIGAVCVILLHAPPLFHSNVPILRMTGWLVREYSQVAVPFFFLLSGWLLGRKWTSGRHGWEEIGRSSRRLGAMYAVWFLVYLGIDASTGLPTDAVTVSRRFLGLTDSRLTTTGYHLWFLPCLMAAQAVCWASLKSWRSCFPAFVAGAFLYLAMDWMELSGMALPWGLSFHEGLNLSLPCTALGAVLASRWSHERPSGARNWLLLSALLAVPLEAAAIDLASGTSTSIHPFQVSRLALGAALLVWASTSEGLAGRAGRWLDSLGGLSLGIYVVHVAVLTLVPFEILVASGFVRENLVRWTSTLAVSSLVAALAVRAPWEGFRNLFR